MSFTVNIYYTGQNGSAKDFANEMVGSGVVDRWDNQAALDSHHKITHDRGDCQAKR